MILPLAGFTASRGGLSLGGAVAWTTAGSVAGALLLYTVGLKLGRDRVRAIAVRLPLIDVADLDRAEGWFVRHGAPAVLLGRFIPVVRSLISVPAGVTRLPVPVFLLLTTLGSLLWNTAFILTGYLLGENWHQVGDYVSVYSRAVLIFVAVAVAVFILLRLRRRVARR